MISLPARLFRFGLRLQRPLLLRLRHPSRLAAVEALLVRAAVLPPHSDSHRLVLGGVPVLALRNQRVDARRGHTLVYVHGGGFNAGSPETHCAFAARLMQAGRFERVLMPRYRLAPAHVFPAAHDDVFAFWAALHASAEAGSVCLAGESAGANLCLVTCLRARDAGLPLPQRLYLHSPWLDVSLSGASYLDPALEDGFTGRRRYRRRWLHNMFARHYAGNTDTAHPHLSPVFADLHGLPPVYVQLGSQELFRDDSTTLQARCREAGTSCELETWQGMWHAFALLGPLLPEARRATARAGAWLAED